MNDRGYQKYLKSKHWRKFKEKYKASNSPQKCNLCGSDNVVLHHITYKNLYRESFYDIVPLCNKHHLSIHEAHDELKIRIDGIKSFRKVRKHVKKIEKTTPLYNYYNKSGKFVNQNQNKWEKFFGKVKLKCFRFGDKDNKDNTVVIGKGISLKDFYSELMIYNTLCYLPFNIFEIDVDKYNQLLIKEGIKVI